MISVLVVLLLLSVVILAEAEEKVCGKGQAKRPRTFKDGKVLLLRLGMTEAENTGAGIKVEVSGCNGDCKYSSKDADIQEEEDGSGVILHFKDTVLGKLKEKKENITEKVKPMLERTLAILEKRLEKLEAGGKEENEKRPAWRRVGSRGSKSSSRGPIRGSIGGSDRAGNGEGNRGGNRAGTGGGEMGGKRGGRRGSQRGGKRKRPQQSVEKVKEYIGQVKSTLERIEKGIITSFVGLKVVSNSKDDIPVVEEVSFNGITCRLPEALTPPPCNLPEISDGCDSKVDDDENGFSITMPFQLRRSPRYVVKVQLTDDVDTVKLGNAKFSKKVCPKTFIFVVSNPMKETKDEAKDFKLSFEGDVTAEDVVSYGYGVGRGCRRSCGQALSCRELKEEKERTAQPPTQPTQPADGGPSDDGKGKNDEMFSDIESELW